MANAPTEDLPVGARTVPPNLWSTHWVVRVTARCSARLLPCTADADSLDRRLRGARWGYYMPGHVVFFGARLLRRLLREEGLEVLATHRGDDHGRLLDGDLARAHGTTVPGRLLRRLRVPFLGAVGAGMVCYARRMTVA